MLRRIAFGLTLGCLALTACDDGGELAPATLQLDLTGCVSAEDTGESCRARLISSAPDAAEQACLVLASPGAADQLHRLPLVWRAGRLVIDGDTTVPLDPGSTIEASLYFLSDQGSSCVVAGHGLRDVCGAGTSCVARFGPVSRPVANGGVTLLDFVEGDRCEARIPAAESVNGDYVEVCGDGIDNDCDGRQDEGVQDPCLVGLGACATQGQQWVCRGDAMVCDATPGSPTPDANCNTIDDDCDGLVDEAGACNACLFDNECLATPETPECVDGQCQACDPADGAGCDQGGDTPFCDPDTLSCRGCNGDGECADGDICVNSTCAACDPTRPETCDEGNTPVCDPVELFCRPCQVGSECPSGICFGGRCAECQPGTNDGCLGPEGVCDLNDLSCRRCQNDAECALLDPAAPVCAEGQCVACSVEDNAGCGDPSQPICASEEPGANPECGPCVDPSECATNQCRNGRCVGCDTGNDSGCDPTGGQPVCADDGAPEGPACRACRGDNECSQPGRRLCAGGRCVECSDADHDGCAEGGERPICQGGVCRACQGNNECIARPGDLDLCVGGACQVCSPGDNRGCEGNTPICNAGDACRGCVADGECDGGQCLPDGRCALCDPADNSGCGGETPICRRDGSACEPCNADNQCPGNTICIGGRCAQCDPITDRGCDAESGAPICDAQTATCRRCGRDADCPGNGQCLGDGRCRQCDPTDNAGCDEGNANPICNDGRCQPCGVDADCARFGLSPVCNAGNGRCVDCVEGSNLGCDPTSAQPICEGGQCRLCRRDDECGAASICEAGRCVGCSVVDNSGCDPLGGAPVCDDGACRACVADQECREPQRTYCIDGTCRGCDADAQSGCLNAVQPYCRAGVCDGCRINAECEALIGEGAQCLPDGRCAECAPVTNQGCDPDSNQPICDPVSPACRRCNQDVECTVGDCDVVSGTCVPCDPGEVESGCDLDSLEPTCDAADLSCRACANAADCAGNPNGFECRGGQCGCADTSDCDGTSRQPACTGNVCSPCARDADCDGHVGRSQCVNDKCRECDLNDERNNRYRGCPNGRPVCAGAGGDEFCTTRCNPNNGNDDCAEGEQCLENGRGDHGCQ